MHSTLNTQPTPRRTNWWTRAIRGAWTSPTNVIGHFAGMLVSGGVGRRVESPIARARVYTIRAPLLRRLGGVTLGHAILLSERLQQGQLGRLVLAHELAHTRQHDLLGPFYLPMHIVAQCASALIWLWKPIPSSDPVHAHNPLEERWLFLGHSALTEVLRGERIQPADLEAFLEQLGC